MPVVLRVLPIDRHQERYPRADGVKRGGDITASGTQHTRARGQAGGFVLAAVATPDPKLRQRLLWMEGVRNDTECNRITNRGMP